MVRGRLVPFLCVCALTGCSRDSPPPAKAPAPAEDDSLEVSFVEGRLRIHYVDSSGRWLIRNRRADRAPADSSRLKDAEAEPVKAWRACLSRFEEGGAHSPLWEHDAWLEVAESLEGLYRADPTHLGVLRDLVTAYVRLLAFERESGLGANLCELASRRLGEFCARAAPLEPADQSLVDRLRSRLRFYTRQYPLALGGDPETDVALALLRQDRFRELSAFEVGPLQARVFRTSKVPPASGAPWTAVHVLLARDMDSPARVVTYALVRWGDTPRWYLLMRFLNREDLVAVYGARRPGVERVCADVRRHAAAALTKAREEQ